MGRGRQNLPPLLLGAAVAVCLVTVGLGLAVPQDAAGVLHERHRRSSNSSTPPEPLRDSSGRPLPPPDGYAHGKGKRDAPSSRDVAFERNRRSSNRSSPPEPPRDSNGRPMPPPDGYAHGKGKRDLARALLRHTFSSGPSVAASEEISNSGAPRQKRSSLDEELVSSADAVETDVVRSRRSSNHSAPPRGQPSNRGRRDAGSDAVSGGGGKWVSAQQVTVERERRASNHSGPPKGPPPGRGRRQLDRESPDAAGGGDGQWDSVQQVTVERERRASNHSHSGHPRGPPPGSNHSRGPPPGRGRRQLGQESPENEEAAQLLRQRRASTSNSSDGSSDDNEDDSDGGTGRGPPPRGRPPQGGAPHGRGPPPRGCGRRRPPSDSGTNSTSTSTGGDTETLERLSRRRSRNRG